MTELGIDASLAALKRGEVLLLDTDTLPGLHALATVDGAADRLAALKGHQSDRPYLLLVDCAEAAFRIGRTATVEQAAQLRTIWPAALTALLRPSADCRPEWTGPGGRVGLRVPASRPLRDYLARLDGPLLSTSANETGCPPATNLVSAARLFPTTPIVSLGTNGGAGASTIVDFTVNPANVARVGIVAYPAESGPDRPA